MAKKRTSSGKNAFRSLAESSKAGFFFLAAGTMLPMRSIGQQLVAFGEGLENLFASAKAKFSEKREKKALQPAKPMPAVQKAPTPEPPVQVPETPVASSVPEESDGPAAPDFTTNGDLALIDAKEEPECYAELLERERRGEIELVRRYRRSYESRLIQSKDPMQSYYSGIKNALLRYKGVKSRISWANETFHQGRNHLAKIIVKTSCLYVYLSVDPEALKGTKFESAVDDVSDTKKFGEFPTVIKIKGERKYKYVLELIDRICAEELALPLNKKFEEIDYRRPPMSDEELAEQGLVKLLVAARELPAE